MKKVAAKAVKKAMATAEKEKQSAPAAASSPPEDESAKDAPDEAAQTGASQPGDSPEADGGEVAAGKFGEAAETPGEDEDAHYPLRKAPEDPRWAVRTVWTWIGITLTSILFILALLVLGAVHD
jgi:hypothetical protein